MQQPSLDPDILFEELLQDLSPESIEMARSLNAFVRAKKVKTPEQLFRLALLYCGLDYSLRSVASTFTLLYEPIVDQSVSDRLRACGPWLKAMLPRMVALPPLCKLPEGRRYLAVDGSSIQAPGAKQTDYRLHICMNLVSLELVEVLVSDVHTGESLRHFTFAPGDVVVADRGYIHPKAMADAVSHGADLVLRLNPFSVVLGDGAGQPFGLCRALKGQRSETIRSFEVTVGSSCGAVKTKGWLHAYRLHPEQASRARRKCRQRHKKGSPKSDTLFLAGWVLVFTTLSPQVLSASAILTLYRCRWQIELTIKRWKSVLDVDALRARANGPLAEVWLHGKLVYALMVEGRMRRKLGDSWGRLDGERTATWWRAWGLLKDEMKPMINGSMCWKASAWKASLKVLAERPRRRKLQQLPPEAIDMLYRCNGGQQHDIKVAA